MTTDDRPRINRNDAEGRFELADTPEQGRLAYREDDGRLVLVRTVVDDDLQGEGVGSALVRAALDYAEDSGLVVVPQCEFVAEWLDRHPERAERLQVEAA